MVGSEEERSKRCALGGGGIICIITSGQSISVRIAVYKISKATRNHHDIISGTEKVQRLNQVWI